MLDLLIAMPACTPHLVRNACKAGLTTSPNNPFMLSILATLELQSGLVFKARRLFDHCLQMDSVHVGVSSNPPPPYVVKIAIATEMRTPAPSQHRMERLLERGIHAQAHAAFAAPLWELYVATLVWEQRVLGARVDHQLKRVRARALEMCPFSKRLWLLQVTMATEEEEVLDVVDQLIDKGIRCDTDPLEAIA